MNKYDQLRKESQKLELKIQALEVWLKNHESRATTFFRCPNEGVCLNDNPKDFTPYMTIANRQSTCYGNLIFEEGDFELEVLISAIVPVLEGLHNKCCNTKQSIDLKLQAVDELLGD